eukprot:11166111-Lingulodinium_polyedra.AAC.1
MLQLGAPQNLPLHDSPSASGAPQTPPLLSAKDRMALRLLTFNCAAPRSRLVAVLWRPPQPLSWLVDPSP